MFSYRMRAFCDPESLWWFVAYSEITDKTAAYILLQVCDTCRLWALSREMIQWIQSLNMEAVLGIADDARECFSLLEAIKGSKFRYLPTMRASRGILSSLLPGRNDSGADFRYFNPFTSPLFSKSEASSVMRAMDRLVLRDNPTGWDYYENTKDFVMSSSALRQLRARIDGWSDAFDEAMDEDDVVIDFAEVEVPTELAEPWELTKKERLQAVRAFLSLVEEISESVLTGEYDAFVAHLQGSLH